METVSAQDQENKRKPARAGSVPPRVTTPVNSLHAYVPGAKTGTVTPAVRARSTSQSVPNKRQRLGEPVPSRDIRKGSGGSRTGHTAHSGARIPLGSYRGGNEGGRASSPSKISGRTVSLTRAVPIAMPIPKPGTLHHALGHGRLPTGGHYAAGHAVARSTSGMTSGGYGSRYAGRGSGYAESEVLKKASRARRESFKPRPSVDGLDMCLSVGLGVHRGRWPGLAGSVREEDEG